MAFLVPEDYNVLIRTEIKSVLLENYSSTKLDGAENMAIAQIKNYISGRYDIDAIFSASAESRNAFIIMIALDCALYHLYSSIAPNKIPEHRAERYQDALEWLKSVAKGETIADLPLLTDEGTGEEKQAIRLTSRYKLNNNKW
ncbi:MAG: phage protein Gp36 family protein [Flavobacteriaceae bacterium]|nr:phage protein Gp36 family protein [Flavobacteriaceae bacterium]